MSTDSVFAELTKIQSWPAVGLVFDFCIVAGYCWKLARFKWFSNEAIPPIVILTGALAMLLLGGDHPENISGLVWRTRQFIVGSIIGFSAWLSHALILSRVEDYLGGIFPPINRLLNPKPPGPPGGIPALLFGFGLLAFTGCVAIAPGSSPFVVNVERSLTVGQGTFDFVLHLDQTDRGFFQTNAPAFHQFCEWLRTPTPVATTNAPRSLAILINTQELKRIYKADRSAGNSNDLYAAWLVLDGAILQSHSWSNIITRPIH